MTHPRDMHISALIFWIEQALKDCFAIDFLSDRAQRSIVQFMAQDLQNYYKWLHENNARENFWQMKYHPNTRGGERYDFFFNSAMQHPLVAMFGETMAKAIEASVRPVIADLEQGKTPETT